MNNKQEELYKILLLPIEKQEMDSYKIEEKVILSGTKYGTTYTFIRCDELFEAIRDLRDLRNKYNKFNK